MDFSDPEPAQSPLKHEPKSKDDATTACNNVSRCIRIPGAWPEVDQEQANPATDKKDISEPSSPTGVSGPDGDRTLSSIISELQNVTSFLIADRSTTASSSSKISPDNLPGHTCSDHCPCVQLLHEASDLLQEEAQRRTETITRLRVIADVLSTAHGTDARTTQCDDVLQHKTLPADTTGKFLYPRHASVGSRARRKVSPTIQMLAKQFEQAAQNNNSTTIPRLRSISPTRSLISDSHTFSDSHTLTNASTSPTSQSPDSSPSMYDAKFAGLRAQRSYQDMHSRFIGSF